MKLLNKVIELIIAIIEKYAKVIAYLMVISVCFKLTRGMIGFIYGSIKSIFKLGAQNI